MKKYIPLLSLAGLLLACQLPAFSAVTSAELQAAIDKAKILAPGTGFNVSVAKGQAVVGTYKNSKANEKDCKIDAVLIAKTIMEVAGEDVVSVTVFFYNRTDLSTYEQVTLSAGDIKAFASGEVAKEQFLSSVKLEHHEAEEAARITSFIQASQQRMARRPAEATIENGNVAITAQMEPWVQPRDVRYEALRIAEKVLEANSGQAFKQVKITFTDPSDQVKEREVILNTDEIQSIDQQVQRALASLGVSHAAARTIEVADGAQVDARRDLSKRVLSLRAAGIETAALEKQFDGLNDAVKANMLEAKLKVLVKKMDDDIATAEKSVRSTTTATAARGGTRVSVTPEEIKAAIRKADVLAPGTAVTVAVKPSEVVIATYKAEIANEKDCKIDATLIAKTVMDLAPKEIASVTVFFYGRNDLSSYEEITLSAGDIRAFATGQLSKEQLISSVKLERHKAEDSARIAGFLRASESGAARRPAQASFRGSDVDVNVQLEPWVQDRDARYEAMRIAEKVREANPSKPVQNVLITFADPDMQAGDRLVSLSPAMVGQLSAAIDTALASIKVTQTGAVESGVPLVAPGPLKEKREDLANRITALKAANVGVSSFIAFFATIEEAAVKGDEATVAALSQKLADVLDQQEKTMKALKDKQSGVKVGGGGGPLAPADPQPTVQGRWASGKGVIDDSIVVRDPDVYLKTFEEKLATWRTDKAVRPFYFHTVRWFAYVLRTNGKTADAQRYDRKIYEMRRAYPELNAEYPRSVTR